MAQLSVLAEMVRKMNPSPSKKGFTRGAMGSTGSRTFQGRNPMAGLEREHETLNSPVMQAFLKANTPYTPMTNTLSRGY